MLQIKAYLLLNDPAEIINNKRIIDKTQSTVIAAYFNVQFINNICTIQTASQSQLSVRNTGIFPGQINDFNLPTNF